MIRCWFWETRQQDGRETAALGESLHCHTFVEIVVVAFNNGTVHNIRKQRHCSQHS